MSIVVIETGHRRYGLVVDKIVDTEEIVVKPLGRHIKGCTCLAGATILGDGNVALILDTAGIAAQANLATSQEQAAQMEREEGAKVQDDHRRSRSVVLQHHSARPICDPDEPRFADRAVSPTTSRLSAVGVCCSIAARICRLFDLKIM